MQKTPGLSLKSPVLQGPFWLYFPEQWDPKSPWHDVRVRQAANLAIDRDGMNKALVPRPLQGHQQRRPLHLRILLAAAQSRCYDPAKAKKLMAEAGHGGGFDAGLLYCDSSYANVAEVAVNNLAAIGITAKLQPLERAGVLRRLFQQAIRQGHRPRRERRVRQCRDPHGLVRRQGRRLLLRQLSRYRRAVSAAGRRDSTTKKRAAVLDKMQQLTYEKSIYAPIWQLGFISGIGPRVGESSFGKIPGFAYTAPFEDITIKT